MIRVAREYNKMSLTQGSLSLQVELVNRIGELDEFPTEPMEGTPGRVKSMSQKNATRLETLQLLYPIASAT